MKIKLGIFVFLLVSLNSCKETKTIKEAEVISEIESATIVEEKESPFDAETSLVLLPRDEYATYSAHYDYMSNEEYFGTNVERISHFDDTIAVELGDNDNKLGLADSLKLGERWLCIGLSDDTRGITGYRLDVRETVSHSANDAIEYVPVTLLSQSDQDDEYPYYNIAFRGDYEKSDFKLLEALKVSEDEQCKVISIIREKISDPNSVPPRPMATDTLLLDKINKVDDKLFVAKYAVTFSSDSDGDFGNDAIFVIYDGKVVEWFAAMYCTPNLFELRGQKYFCLDYSTYATGVTKLFKIGDGVEEIYSNLFWGD